VWGCEFTTEASKLQGGFSRVHLVGLDSVVARARFLVYDVLNRGSQVVSRGSARCASQVLDRGQVLMSAQRGLSDCDLESLVHSCRFSETYRTDDTPIAPQTNR
jgi:hypothetical protein